MYGHIRCKFEATSQYICEDIMENMTFHPFFRDFTSVDDALTYICANRTHHVATATAMKKYLEEDVSMDDFPFLSDHIERVLS